VLCARARGGLLTTGLVSGPACVLSLPICLPAQKRTRRVAAFKRLSEECRAEKIDLPFECTGLPMMLCEEIGNAYMSTDEDAPGASANSETAWHTHCMPHRSARAATALAYLTRYETVDAKHHSSKPCPLRKKSCPTKETANMLWTYDPEKWSVSRAALSQLMATNHPRWVPKDYPVRRSQARVRPLTRGGRRARTHTRTRASILISFLCMDSSV
jgi:hypothetical protein